MRQFIKQMTDRMREILKRFADFYQQFRINSNILQVSPFANCSKILVFVRRAQYDLRPVYAFRAAS